MRIEVNPYKFYGITKYCYPVPIRKNGRLYIGTEVVQVKHVVTKIVKEPRAFMVYNEDKTRLLSITVYSKPSPPPKGQIHVSCFVRGL